MVYNWSTSINFSTFAIYNPKFLQFGSYIRMAPSPYYLTTMKHPQPILPLIFILLLTLASCGQRRAGGFADMKWEPLGREADSLNLLLESRFYDADPYDSIRMLIERLESAPVSKDAGRRRLTSRVAFWKTRLAERERGTPEADSLLRMAFELTDSASSPYTYNRLLTIRESIDSDSATLRMSRLMESLRYYQSVGDQAMEGATSILIAHALADSYQLDFALEYFLRADSLHHLSGLDKYVSKNRINRCSILYKMGNKAGGDSLMSVMLADPDIRKDPLAYNTVLRNSYIFSNNFERLKEGAEQMMTIDSTSPRNAVYDILLGQHYRKEGNDPEADIHTRRAFAKLDRIADQELRCAILRDMVTTLRHEGLSDSASRLQEQYIDEFEKLTDMRQPREMAHLHTLQIVTRYEMESAAARSYYVVRMLILSIILVLVGSVGILLLVKARQRHRLQQQRIILDRVQSQLEKEEHQRQYLALSIAMEETDRHLEQIREQIETLNKEGKVSYTEMTSVRQVLQQHANNRDDWKQFNELFSKAHPMFDKNLSERYPGLSEGQRKLAVYIYTGMNNKQIAQFLNVRPESVKQARWRLRVKMGLSSDESLEESLRCLA